MSAELDKNVYRHCPLHDSKVSTTSWSCCVTSFQHEDLTCLPVVKKETRNRDKSLPSSRSSQQHEPQQQSTVTSRSRSSCWWFRRKKRNFFLQDFQEVTSCRETSSVVFKSCVIFVLLSLLLCSSIKPTSCLHLRHHLENNTSSALPSIPLETSRNNRNSSKLLFFPRDHHDKTDAVEEATSVKLNGEVISPASLVKHRDEQELREQEQQNNRRHEEVVDDDVVSLDEKELHSVLLRRTARSDLTATSSLDDDNIDDDESVDENVECADSPDPSSNNVVTAVDTHDGKGGRQEKGLSEDRDDDQDDDEEGSEVTNHEEDPLTTPVDVSSVPSTVVSDASFNTIGVRNPKRRVLLSHHGRDINFESLYNISFTRQEYNVSIPESASGKTYASVIIDTSAVREEVNEAENEGERRAGEDEDSARQSRRPRKWSHEDADFHFSPYVRMGVHIPETHLKVSFKIVSGDDKKLFKTERERVGDFVFLRIRTPDVSEGELNREYQDYYLLKVRGTITSRRSKSFRVRTFCDVHLHVEDSNDLSPLFYPTTYNIEVPQETPVDTKVKQVTAFDSDTGLNGEIYYSLDPSEEELDFAVHPTTGGIYLVRPLDLSLGRKRQLVIYATDRERGGFSSLNSAKRINLAANTGSVLAQQSRALVNVHISQSSRRKSSLFGRDSFVSSSSSKLETTSSETDDSLSSSSQVYHFSVPENSRLATILGQINETSLLSDSISYNSINSNHILNHSNNKSLSSSSASSYRYKLLNFKSKFAIDSKSGIITVKGLIDREEKHEYRLHVSLRETSSGSSSLIPVVVSVTDVNDNPPRFRDKTYYTRVREDLPVGAVIMRMHAVDEDEGPGGVIKYSIKKESTRDEGDAFFSIDDKMGNIRIARELDYELKQVFNLTIIARDEGKPSFSSTAHLLIEVEDIDENAFTPRFETICVKGSIRENSPLRSHVMDIQAIDDDFQLSRRVESGRERKVQHHHSQPSFNSPRVTYKLVGGNGIGKFTLNEETGGITTTGNLDREKESRFWLTVEASDKSPIPKSSHVHVYIDVEDEDEYSPRTLLPFYTTSIPENASVGSEVLVLNAKDDDATSSSGIVYRLLPSSDQEPFAINNETGRITTKDKLDRALQAQYILDIEVSQVNPEGTSGHSLMSRTPVIINVGDVNDKPTERVSHSLLKVYYCLFLAFCFSSQSLHLEANFAV